MAYLYLGFGIALLLFFAVLLAFLDRVVVQDKRRTFWTRAVRNRSGRTKRPPKNPIQEMSANVHRWAEALNKPSWPALLPRLTVLSAVCTWGLFALFDQPLLGVLAALLALFFPYLWMQSQYRSSQILLRRQMQNFLLFVAYMVKAGAPIDRAIRASVRIVDYPLRPYLSDAVATIGRGGRGELQLDTVSTAMQTMASRVGVVEAVRFSQIVSQTEQYDTNLGDVLIEMIDIDLRDKEATAEEKLNQVSSKMEYLGQFGLSMPLYLFILFAVFAYIEKYLGTIHL